MTEFNWHADFFDDGAEGGRSVRRAVIKADNADEAEKAENDRIAVCCSRSQSKIIVLDI
jgi:hypothetical protein